jgi:Ferredoxin subunits of nitrite reductase and ring-hydroxylating dioxygenases
MAFVAVAKKDKLLQDAMLSVPAGGTDVLLVNAGGIIYAYEDSCEHMGVPLSMGTLRDNVVTCSAHHWSYNVCTGRGINPDTACLKNFPVNVEGDDILVDFGDQSSESEPKNA